MLRNTQNIAIASLASCILAKLKNFQERKRCKSSEINSLEVKTKFYDIVKIFKR